MAQSAALGAGDVGLELSGEPGAVRSRRWWAWLGAVLVAAGLLFAHGCHGDEDNELFAVVSNRSTPADAPR
jgi:hypothetical protein